MIGTPHLNQTESKDTGQGLSIPWLAVILSGALIAILIMRAMRRK
jgi:hypothetical protein